MFQGEGLASEGTQAQGFLPTTAPDGTVTIMFTDIESFTALTERLGDRRTQDVLRAHRAIVREQVATHGGREVSVQGDGFMVAFTSARRALPCAIAIQRAVDAPGERRPEESIRLRVGLHTGEAIREHDDFFGKNVIIAARIASTAQGGEILVSPQLKELAESSGDFRFDDGRLVELKGLSGRYRLFRVAWSDRPFAPARNPLPPASSSAFHREGDYWTLVYEGKVVRLRDSKGLRDIAQLLNHPGQELHVFYLAGIALSRAADEQAAWPTVQGAGPLLDGKAKADVRHRLSELREELEEAERFNDPGRAARARDEIDCLTSYVAAATGLGGRDRKAASNVERARVMVTVRIKAALKKIRAAHPPLGHHLATTIKTGRFCVYNPDPARPVSWLLGFPAARAAEGRA